MKKVKTLTKLEWDIMKLIWKEEKTSVSGILQNLHNGKHRAYTTIQTYMERLVKKGYLSKEKIGLVNFYSPEIKEKDALIKETDYFVNNAFNGSFSRLATFLFDTQVFNENDLEEIKRLIEQKEADNA